eukprot:COSAG01_NODE_7892_length_3004_cov_1.537694_3_plen_175_part_00
MNSSQRVRETCGLSGPPSALSSEAALVWWSAHNQDGFAGWKQSGAKSARTSRLVTRAVTISGSALFATLDVVAGDGGGGGGGGNGSPGASLRVGILDASSAQPLPGFRTDDCVALNETGTDVQVHWGVPREAGMVASEQGASGGSSLRHLQGRNVSLVFELSGWGVTVYSYSFA